MSTTTPTTPIATITSPAVLEDAVRFLRTYVPDTVLDNWRVVGTTAVMIGLCLCPIIGSAWGGGDTSTSTSTSTSSNKLARASPDDGGDDEDDDEHLDS